MERGDWRSRVHCRNFHSREGESGGIHPPLEHRCYDLSGRGTYNQSAMLGSVADSIAFFYVGRRGRRRKSSTFLLEVSGSGLVSIRFACLLDGSSRMKERGREKREVVKSRFCL